MNCNDKAIGIIHFCKTPHIFLRQGHPPKDTAHEKSREEMMWLSGGSEGRSYGAFSPGP